MILDKQLLFSDAQTVTTGSDTGVVSTHCYDLGSTNIDIGTGEDLYVVVSIDTTMDDTGDNSALTVYLCHDDNTSLTSPTNFQTIGTFAAVSAAGSTPLIAKVSPYVVPERYIGIQYVAAGGALSAGAFTACIVSGAQLSRLYPDAMTVQ